MQKFCPPFLIAEERREGMNFGKADKKI